MTFSNEKQRIIFVTGKGGVGKSTVAAAVAQKLAQGGQNTLLVELGEQSYFQYVYKRPITYSPTEISSNYSIALWSGETCLKEYVFYLIRVKKIVDLFFENKIMRSFIRAAPALKELAILGKITSGVRGWGPELNYDNIVIDAFSSGHFMALLKAPRGMADLISAGPMGEQSRAIDEVLKRADICEYRVVSLPEELPVSETIELAADLKQVLGVDAKVICNRVYQPLVSGPDLKAISEDRESSVEAREFASFVIESVSRQEVHLEKIRQNFVKALYLPFLFEADGVKVISSLSSTIEGGGPA